jgi:tetratricopeptide (TPR) repeat protein
MTPAIILALAIGALADPCAAVQATAVRDPAAAAAYRRVGDSERAAGSFTTATIAYQSALAHDPSDQASREALRRLCQEARAASRPFDEGLRLMDAGDRKGAIAAFRRAKANGPDPSASLLEGICQYELGEDRLAELLLREAEARPAHQGVARFYLGLIALRSGAAVDAASFFESASVSPALAAIASDLTRNAHRSGRLVLSFLVESGWDSNVIQLPSGAKGSGQVSGGSVGLSGTVLYRPLGESGPYLRASGLYHRQMQIDGFDVGGLSGAAGWQLGLTHRNLVAGYDYDYRTLEGTSYLSAHRLLTSGWLSLGTLGLGATGFVRFESYRSSDYSQFSGTLFGAEARATLSVSRSAWLGFAYQFERDATKQEYTSWIEHGPRVELRWRPGRSVGLGFLARAGFLSYDVADPTFAADRSDIVIDGAAFMEYDLADHWTARLTVEGRRELSSISAFDYMRIVPTFRITYVLGI